MPKQSDSFLYQNSSYHGQVKPENLLFIATAKAIKTLHLKHFQSRLEDNQID